MLTRHSYVSYVRFMERNSNGLAGLVAITAVFAIGLHQFGAVPGLTIEWTDPVNWVESARTDEIIGATARQIGLVVSYWVLLSALAYTAMVRTGRRSRLVTMLTMPWIRRAVDRGLAATLAVSMVAGPVGPGLAEEPPPVVVFETSHDGIPVPHVPLLVAERSSDAEATADATPPAAVGIVPPRPAISMTPVEVYDAGVAQSTPAAAASTYVVKSGDNLWRIAQQHLAGVLEDPPSSEATAAYWREIVADNRDTLRSGDPNLIYPGEVVALPSVEVSA